MKKLIIAVLFALHTVPAYACWVSGLTYVGKKSVAPSKNRAGGLVYFLKKDDSYAKIWILEEELHESATEALMDILEQPQSTLEISYSTAGGPLHCDSYFSPKPVPILLRHLNDLTPHPVKHRRRGR